MQSHPVILLKGIWPIADKRKRRIAQHIENRTIDGAVELLETSGFDGLAEAVTVLGRVDAACEEVGEELCGTDISSTQVSRAAAELDSLLDFGMRGLAQVDVDEAELRTLLVEGPGIDGLPELFGREGVLKFFRHGFLSRGESTETISNKQCVDGMKPSTRSDV